jgi:hypothetical protein
MVFRLSPLLEVLAYLIGLREQSAQCSSVPQSIRSAPE